MSELESLTLLMVAHQNQASSKGANRRQHTARQYQSMQASEGSWNGTEPVGSHHPNSADDEGEAQEAIEDELGDSGETATFSSYTPAWPVAPAGSSARDESSIVDRFVPHPDPVTEAASLSSVPNPKPTYVLAMPQNARQDGRLSSLQLEAIALACGCHEARLPGGEV